MIPIAHIQTDLPCKFGIPRQSGLVPELKGKIVFESEYRNADAVRGLDGFSHVWLLWEFSDVQRNSWSPTVRPPRLGGNKRIGVFASRSPFRPNPIGLSVVRLNEIEQNEKLGAILHVSGVDLMDGTPIYDIKPYISYTDRISEASGGFTSDSEFVRLHPIFPEELLRMIPKEKHQALLKLLALDPRPAYQTDSQRIYGFSFAGYDIRFQVNDDVLTVVDVSLS
ncbi:MAG: tRNA (N6-threonylcarbamoyladenosine(37)-N6)-methyltransferase TrmO [Paludibacteraceae bacterium]